MATVLDRPDILVRTTTGSPIAVIEVSNPMGVTAEIATANRRAYFDHGLTAVAPFFLLVSQDTGHVWREPAPADAPPDLSFSMTPVISRYFRSATEDGRLLGRTLESVVFQWLFDIIHLGGGGEEEPERTLANIGFLDAIRRTDVEIDASE